MTERTSTRRVTWLAGFLAVLAGLGTYYWYEWRSFETFVYAVDHSRYLQDFVGHYYPMGQQLLQTATPAGGYLYSSFFAVLLVPFGRLPLQSAIAAWSTVQVVCMAALLIVSARGFLKLRPTGSLAFMILFATSYPVLNNFKWGQVSVLLTLCVVAAVVAARAGHSVLAGVLLAFGTSIKFYPALFVIYFVAKRDMRGVLAFFAGFVTFYMLVPSSFLGLGRWLAFEQSVAGLLTGAGLAARDPNSQYVGSVVMRWLTPIAPSDLLALLRQCIVYTGFAIGAAAIGMGTLAARRRDLERTGLPVVAVFLALPFLVKTSWPHYFSYLPVCQAAVLVYYVGVGERPWRAVNLTLCLLSVAFSNVVVFNRFSGWGVYNSVGMLFLANLLLLIPVFAGLARVWRRDVVPDDFAD